jgi:hypothetical protein
MSVDLRVGDELSTCASDVAQQRGLEESTDAGGPNLLERSMRSPRSQAEEAVRLDAANTDTLKDLENIRDARRASELRLKLYRLQAERGRIAVIGRRLRF